MPPPPSNWTLAPFPARSKGTPPPSYPPYECDPPLLARLSCGVVAARSIRIYKETPGLLFFRGALLNRRRSDNPIVMECSARHRAHTGRRHHWFSRQLRMQGGGAKGAHGENFPTAVDTSPGTPAHSRISAFGIPCCTRSVPYFPFFAPAHTPAPRGPTISR